MLETQAKAARTAELYDQNIDRSTPQAFTLVFMSVGTKAIVLRIDKFQALNVLSGIRSPRYTHTFQRWARQACRLCTFLKHFRCLFPTARSTEIRLEAFK